MKLTIQYYINQSYDLNYYHEQHVKIIFLVVTIPSVSLLYMSLVGSTRREGGVPAYVNLSASSMLMIAMQYTTNPGKPSFRLYSKHASNSKSTLLCCVVKHFSLCFLLVYHCQLLECLMKHKQEVWKVRALKTDIRSLM